MITFPNAKINLGLNIVSKRPDGYHNIETVFYPIPWHDALEIVPAPDGQSTSLIQTGIPIDGDPHANLVYKAYRLLKADYDLPEISIYLQKNIPFGAGLGGGSADAAEMLKLLNDFAHLELSDVCLAGYAAQLGADCPFFIYDRPLFAEGIGNIFSPIDVSLEGYALVIVRPPIHVPTPEAYAGARPQIPAESIRTILARPPETWKDCLTNDFEPSIFARHPTIGGIKRTLYDRGAIYASLSGSGSAVFGVFDGLPALASEFPGSILYTIPAVT
jgi:4-diphosphocytidyl-2-C-methyl-D-erythritol kinase